MIDFKEIKVAPTKMKDYLENNNWTYNSDFPNKNLFVFKKYFQSHEKEITLVLPTRADFEDYEKKSLELIEKFSLIENIKLEQVVADLNDSHRDVMSFRIDSDKSRDGTLPLNEALSIISGIKNLITTSICNEKQQKPYHKRLTPESKSYANTYRFAQTNKGSFVINIESDNYSKLDRKIDLNGDLEVPVVRRALERIHKGIDFIKEENDEDTLKELSFRIGFNANMCESLTEIAENDYGMRLDSIIQFSNAIEVNPELVDISKSIKMGVSEFEKARMLAEYYRNLENYEDIEIIGRITTLNAKWKDNHSGVLLDNVITVSWYDSLEQRNYNCKVQLTESEYRQACNAHRDKKHIGVIGRLDRNRKRWFLEEHKRFHVVD